jgi:hypothetical protein
MRNWGFPLLYGMKAVDDGRDARKLVRCARLVKVPLNPCLGYMQPPQPHRLPIHSLHQRQSKSTTVSHSDQKRNSVRNQFNYLQAGQSDELINANHAFLPRSQSFALSTSTPRPVTVLSLAVLIRVLRSLTDGADPVLTVRHYAW